MNLIEDKWDLKPSVDRLGKVWAIEELVHKPYPSGRASHGIIRLLEEILLEQKLNLSDIKSLKASVPPLILRLVGRSWKKGLSLAQARLCLPFLVATYLIKGKIDLNSYHEDWFKGNEWHETASKLSIEVNDVKDPNALVPQQLKVETRDGRFYAKSTSEVYGSPSAPMSEDEQFQKFSGCLYFSGIQGMNDRRSQWEKWFDFHKLDSVHELITEFRIT